MSALPEPFRRLPLAHRGYHDIAAGRPENSLPAFGAAIRHGYGIELDVQLSADGEAMVFHDYHLQRLTGKRGAIRRRGSDALTAVRLRGADTGIPTLAGVLAFVAGRVPLLIELKDQDRLGDVEPGTIERAAASALAGYDGPAAVMSFNPQSVIRLASAAPNVPRGLTTGSFSGREWKDISADARARLRAISDYDAARACFISHEAKDLGRPRVSELKSAGATVLCWTVRSPEAEAEARRIADNITFEGYPARVPPG